MKIDFYIGNIYIESITSKKNDEAFNNIESVEENNKIIFSSVGIDDETGRLFITVDCEYTAHKTNEQSNEKIQVMQLNTSFMVDVTVKNGDDKKLNATQYEEILSHKTVISTISTLVNYEVRKILNSMSINPMLTISKFDFELSEDL